jgi:hypothetical protein
LVRTLRRRWNSSVSRLVAELWLWLNWQSVLWLLLLPKLLLLFVLLLGAVLVQLAIRFMIPVLTQETGWKRGQKMSELALKLVGNVKSTSLGSLVLLNSETGKISRWEVGGQVPRLTHRAVFESGDPDLVDICRLFREEPVDEFRV